MENTLSTAQTTPTPQKGAWHVSIWAGIFIGGLFTLPLIAFLFLADNLLGLPFLPFDVFSFVRDLIPGAILTFGIDSMIGIIRIFGLDLDTAAKLAEQGMAIGMVVVIGSIVGGIIYASVNRIKRDAGTIGAILGVVLGTAMALIVAGKNITATANPIASLLWVMVLYALWGLALGWAYHQLQTIGARPIESATTAKVQQIDRRKFLVQIGGATATLTVVGAGLGALLQPEVDTSDAFEVTTTGETLTSQPNVDTAVVTTIADLTMPVGTRPEITPLDEHYRIDISARPPLVDAESYRLKVHGMVEAPLEIKLTDLVEGYEAVNQYITLSCISNNVGGDLISTTTWTGIPFKVLMDAWKVDPLAQYAKILGADGFDEWVPLGVARNDERMMLTYAWDGQPLKQKHGFPLRIYIPDRYGMKQPKWITDIEFVREWGEGYWVRRTWSEQAIVQTTSVVDTVSTDEIYERDGVKYVPIGGIAYSGAKGISAVEIKVDDGDWMPAQLKTPLSDTTWVLWRFDWAFTPGQHTFRVRAKDRGGKEQIESDAPVRPDGATGIHFRRATLEG
ncbi:MAG: molybdopterin-dependent oxidoreductase [bacterium]|nr:molybdopterin-dependent oxidoreductase [bacterium]